MLLTKGSEGNQKLSLTDQELPWTICLLASPGSCRCTPREPVCSPWVTGTDRVTRGGEHKRRSCDGDPGGGKGRLAQRLGSLEAVGNGLVSGDHERWGSWLVSFKKCLVLPKPKTTEPAQPQRQHGLPRSSRGGAPACFWARWRTGSTFLTAGRK